MDAWKHPTKIYIKTLVKFKHMGEFRTSFQSIGKLIKRIALDTDVEGATFHDCVYVAWSQNKGENSYLQTMQNEEDQLVPGPEY